MWSIETTDTFDAWFDDLDDTDRANVPASLMVLRERGPMLSRPYADIHLAELRELVQKTQAEMTLALDIKQPTVAGMEKPGRDLKLSSLKRYVEAAGGKLRLDIELPDGTHYGFSV